MSSHDSNSTLPTSSGDSGQCTFNVEHTTTLNGNEWREAIALSDFPMVADLRTMFASVKVLSIRAEARQNMLAASSGDSFVPDGHVFLAIIPTVKNTDASTGHNAETVMRVPNKQTFPLSSVSQSYQNMTFDLNGYETDLAQDPRRGAGPVAWIGNSGSDSDSDVILTVTWRLSVACSGATPVWK